ncbi:MAG TPA: GH25 family lysozyme [Polyangiaceae bacterium]
MRFWSLPAITVAAVLLGNACSNGSEQTPLAPTLQDEYEPVTDVSASGGITQITFEPDGAYYLKRSMGTGADEILVPEQGLYSLDLADGTLTLTPNGGASVKHPFQLGLAGSPAGTSQPQGAGLHTDGLGGKIIHLIISFLLDNQWFHTDTPATPDQGAVDDGGWTPDDAAVPTDDASSGGDGASCTTTVIDAGPPASSGGGIDVSHYQGSVNWANVKTVRNFAYAKATESTSYTDSKFVANYAGMQAAGLQRGAYHFFRASKDAVTQADHFASVIKAAGYGGGDLAPMVDVEVTDGVSAATVISGLRAFLNEAQSKLGTTLMIYTGPSFWTHNLGNPDFSSNPLWIAHYTSAPHPTVPTTWSGYTIWQFTQSDKVTGVGGNVDGDRWAGAVAESDGGTGGSQTVTTCTSDAGEAGSWEAGDSSDEGLIPGGCTHDVCTAGERLGQSCNSCTMIVCANDPYCCDTYWGLSCFPDVQKYCGQTCP